MRGKRLYRRGEIIWWRRSFRLSDGRDLSVRLSLRTGDPIRARYRAALLGMTTGDVRRMVESLNISHPWLTTAQMQRIAKTMFEETMGIFAINDLWASWPPGGRAGLIDEELDYLDWVAANGGRHRELSPEDCRRLEAEGWSSDRIDMLSYWILRSRDISGDQFDDGGKLRPMLEQMGVEPHATNLRGGLMAMIQGQRDALIALKKLGADPAAAVSLLPAAGETLLGVPLTRPRPSAETMAPLALEGDHGHGLRTNIRLVGEVQGTSSIANPSHAEARLEPASKAASIAGATLRLIDATEQCISDYGAGGGWSKDTCKQVRTAVELFLFVAGQDCLVEEITQSHLGGLMALFEKLPNRYGRTREEIAGGLAASLARAEELGRDDPHKVGLSQITKNKHLTWLAQVFAWAEARGHKTAESLDFNRLRKGAGKKARKHRQRLNAKRASWTREEIARLLAAPVWTGSHELFDRFSPGEHVWHDAWYWAPLMIVLYGGRSSELVALELAHMHEDAAVPFFWIEFSELRDLKSIQSIRRLPIHPELVRLGFIEYVQALRALGHTALFPEMHSPASQSFASTFYKSIFQEWRSWAFPNGTDWQHQARGITKDKDVHSFRGTASSLLKGRVEDAVRFDLLGHEGNNTTTKIYDEEAELPIKLAALGALSELTEHIQPRPLNLRPIEWRKFGKPRGRRRTQLPASA